MDYGCSEYILLYTLLLLFYKFYCFNYAYKISFCISFILMGKNTKFQ